MSDASSLWRVRCLEDDSVTCMYLSLWFFGRGLTWLYGGWGEDFVLCTIDKGEFEKEGPITTFPTMGHNCISTYLENIVFNIEAENSFYDMKSKGSALFARSSQFYEPADPTETFSVRNENAAFASDVVGILTSIAVC